MESIIKWKTGEPKEVGFYLATLKDGDIMIEYLSINEDGNFYWFGNVPVIAWCKLSDIEPYKEIQNEKN